MKRFGGGSIGIVLALVLGACGGGGASGPQPVVGVGDSLMRLAAPRTEKALGGYNLTLRYRDGQAIAKMLPDLQAAIRQGEPKAVFVNLGSNDALQRRPPEAVKRDLDRMVRVTKPVPCVILTTISTYIDEARKITTAKVINGRMRWLHEQDPGRYQIVDWNAALHRPKGVQKYLMLDGIHENPTGGQWLGDQYAKALLRCDMKPAATG